MHVSRLLAFSSYHFSLLSPLFRTLSVSLSLFHDLFSPTKLPHLKMSYSSLTLLLLLLLAATAQAIRSGPMSLSNLQGFQEGKERNSVEGSDVGEIVIGTNGKHSGNNRNLMTNEKPTNWKIEKSGVKGEATTPSKTSGAAMDQNREDFSVRSSSSAHQQSKERYPDIVDIAGMDYSPAKRKPPIHN